MNFSEIFSKTYLFDPMPSAKSKYYLALIIVFGILILASATLLFLKKMDSRLKNRQLYCYATIGILGYVYLFGRYEQLPWLGSRIFLLLILLALVIWSGINIIWMMDYSVELKSNHILKDRYEKYLPKARIKKK